MQQLNKPIGIVSFIVILFTCAALIISFKVEQDKSNIPPLPQLHGQYLLNPVTLPTFNLVNQLHQPFSNSDLMGDWHLLSYGYLNCPDICPNTLLILRSLHAELTTAMNGSKSNDITLTAPKIIFYSVDQLRDRPKNLQAYLSYFNDEFIGLTSPTKDTTNQTLARGLGIKSKTEYDQNSGAQLVSHDVALFLINPKGELQAILKPYASSDDNLPYFSSANLLADVLKTMKFYQQINRN
ncbi:SCO family protein [Colwelliaceae bacterium BS250]